MKYLEKAVNVQIQDCNLLGIVSLPAGNVASKQRALLIVTGGAQYRIGSHRQFTNMARQLSSVGYPVMRFDMPGMGDSTGQPLPFEETGPHIAASIEVLMRISGVHKVYLWGLCDGASANLIYMHATQDNRIAGLILLNPWIRSDTSLARVHIKHYYPKRLVKFDFWYKLISGKIGMKAIRELINSIRKMFNPISFIEDSIQKKMAKGWASFKGPILLLLSERDLVAQEFKEYSSKNKEWKKIIQKKPANQYIIREADHTCSQPSSHSTMVLQTAVWLESLE